MERLPGSLADQAAAHAAAAAVADDADAAAVGIQAAYRGSAAAAARRAGGPTESAEHEVSAAAPVSLPPGWTQEVSRSTGETYYWNNETGETQWEPPDATAAADLPRVPSRSGLPALLLNPSLARRIPRAEAGVSAAADAAAAARRAGGPTESAVSIDSVDATYEPPPRIPWRSTEEDQEAARAAAAAAAASASALLDERADADAAGAVKKASRTKRHRFPSKPRKEPRKEPSMPTTLLSPSDSESVGAKAPLKRSGGLGRSGCCGARPEPSRRHAGGPAGGYTVLTNGDTVETVKSPLYDGMSGGGRKYTKKKYTKKKYTKRNSKNKKSKKRRKSKRKKYTKRRKSFRR
jgi:hypothetical protein